MFIDEMMMTMMINAQGPMRFGESGPTFWTIQAARQQDEKSYGAYTCASHWDTWEQ